MVELCLPPAPDMSSATPCTFSRVWYSGSTDAMRTDSCRILVDFVSLSGSTRNANHLVPLLLPYARRTSWNGNGSFTLAMNEYFFDGKPGVKLMRSAASYKSMRRSASLSHR
jgi:hypothetical protein